MNPVVSVVKHSVLRTFSVFCVIAILVLIGLGIKRILYPPKTESYAQVVQSGGINYNIEVYTPEDSFFIGLRIFGLKFGISKPLVKRIKEITEEIK